MPSSLTMNRRNGEFLVTDLGPYSRESGWADPTISMQSGTPIALRASDSVYVPWSKTAQAGSGVEVLKGYLYNETFSDAVAAAIPVAIIANDAEVSTSYGRVPALPAGTVHADLVAASAALRIKVRD